jgi:hypothetical protein
LVFSQQGPSSLPQNQLHLREWSARFAEEIRAVGGRPALYMVWPEEERLYGPDRFHPSELGSILAGFVIYQQLFDRSPVGLPATLEPTTSGLPTLVLDAALASTLQGAAAEANERLLTVGSSS